MICDILSPSSVVGLSYVRRRSQWETLRSGENASAMALSTGLRLLIVRSEVIRIQMSFRIMISSSYEQLVKRPRDPWLCQVKDACDKRHVQDNGASAQSISFQQRNLGQTRHSTRHQFYVNSLGDLRSIRPKPYSAKITIEFVTSAISSTHATGMERSAHGSTVNHRAMPYLRKSWGCEV